MPSLAQPTLRIPESAKAILGMARPRTKETFQFVQRATLSYIAPRENDGRSPAQIHEIPLFLVQTIEHKKAPSDRAKLSQTCSIPLDAARKGQPQRMGHVTENPGLAPPRAVDAEHTLEIVPALPAKLRRFFLVETRFAAGTVRNPPPQLFEIPNRNRPTCATVNPALQPAQAGERISREIEEASPTEQLREPALAQQQARQPGAKQAGLTQEHRLPCFALPGFRHGRGRQRGQNDVRRKPDFNRAHQVRAFLAGHRQSTVRFDVCRDFIGNRAVLRGMAYDGRLQRQVSYPAFVSKLIR